ncbi:MAG: hormogonium polysaccharide secretion pseudopilin HpsC [Chroococcidiopsidaceae cyanobacterium CP_BM_RX_35]|nr:hormogonium polysaccharide secretion pseudopilin HpsC [Chroococcidiopsidaceae cyanobacterium CP_BM_RX_35]
MVGLLRFLNKFVLLLGTRRKGSKRRSRLPKGFTLIELLVAIILAFLVLVPLFGLMINIMNTDHREQAKATSEQEIQIALDYISQDLEQAVYIYDADGLNHNSTDNPPGIKDQIPPIAKDSANCSDPNSCVPVLVFWKREFNQDAVPVNGTPPCQRGESCVDRPSAVTDPTSSQKDDSFVYSLVAYYLIEGNKTTNSSSESPMAQIGRFQIKDGVRNPNDSNSYVNEKDTDIGRSLGFKPFDLSLSGTLKQKMNRWTNAGEEYTARTDTLINYIDQDDNITANCATNTQQVPSTLIGGFYACVDSSITLAQVYMRGNALARIQQSPKYNPSLSTYFPIASIQVQGRGLLDVQ